MKALLLAVGFLVANIAIFLRPFIDSNTGSSNGYPATVHVIEAAHYRIELWIVENDEGWQGR